MGFDVYGHAVGDVDAVGLRVWRRDGGLSSGEFGVGMGMTDPPRLWWGSADLAGMWRAGGRA